MSDFIPDHILIDILQKLPVKALLRCRCVCKSWNSLITSPSFVTTQYTTAENSHLLVRCLSRIELKGWYALFQPNNTLYPASAMDFPIASRSTRVPFEVVGSVYGLLCLVDGLDCDLVVVWNPMIRRHIKLPVPTITSSVAFVGLGFDHSINDFKVVRLAYTYFDVDQTYRARVEIWSLQHPVWRALPDHEGVKCHHMAKPGSSAFFMNGSIHWLAMGHSPRASRGERNPNTVLQFNVEKERFETLGIPDEIKYINIYSMWLSKFGSSLALLCFDNRMHPSRCVIWVMSEYGMEESWTLMISSDLQLGVENKSWVREHWTNMVIVTNESELSTASYDPDHDEYGSIFSLDYEKGESVTCVDTFTESLVLLDTQIGALSSSMLDESDPGEL